MVWKLWPGQNFNMKIKMRAMMTLDRSPESFSPQNEFYLFVPIVPTCDPRVGASFAPYGHHMNKIDKGLQRDATYQKSKFYPFQFYRIEVGLLCSYAPTCDPLGGVSFDPRGII